jgi:hypothetical protein
VGESDEVSLRDVHVKYRIRSIYDRWDAPAGFVLMGSLKFNAAL